MVCHPLALPGLPGQCQLFIMLEGDLHFSRWICPGIWSQTCWPSQSSGKTPVWKCLDSAEMDARPPAIVPSQHDQDMSSELPCPPSFIYIGSCSPAHFRCHSPPVHTLADTLWSSNANISVLHAGIKAQTEHWCKSSSARRSVKPAAQERYTCEAQRLGTSLVWRQWLIINASVSKMIQILPAANFTHISQTVFSQKLFPQCS